MACPVMLQASSEAKKAVNFPMSSGVWGLCIGVPDDINSVHVIPLDLAFFVPLAATIGVHTIPGHMQFTLMLNGAS